MRRIRVGDKVQAFLDPKIKGTVVEVTFNKNDVLMSEGVPMATSFAKVDLGNHRFAIVRMSELYYVG